MAREVIFKVGTSEAVKSIGDLRNNIKALKEALNDTELSWNEQQQLVQQLTENQAALRNAMHATTGAFEDVTRAAIANSAAFDENNNLTNAESLSYNELSRTLTKLKEEWRTTTDEAKRVQLGEQINSVNDRLKELDASVGTYGRNVGNYVGSLQQFTQGLGSLGKGASSIIGPIKGADGALKAMSANPVVAIIGVLAMVLDKVVREMKGAEESSMKLQAAMSPLAAVGDALKVVLQGIGDVVIGLIGGFTKLAAAIGLANDKTQQRLELAEQEKQLAEQSRDTIVANAEMERYVAYTRERAADKEKYTAEERLKFLEDAELAERNIAKRTLEDLTLQYNIVKQKNALAKSSKKDLDAEAQAYAAMVQAEAAYYNTITKYDKEKARVRKEDAREKRTAAKQAEEARKAELESYRALLRQEIALLEKGGQERLDKEKELLLKEYEAAVANARQKITNSTTLNRTLLALKKKYDQDVQQAERDHQEAQLAIELQALKNTAAQYAKGTVENLRALKDLRLREMETLHREEGESAEAFRGRELEAQRAYADAVRALDEKVVAQTTEGLQLAYAKSAHTQQQTLEYEHAMAEARVAQIESLGRAAEETETAYQIRLAQARKDAADKLVALQDYQTQQEVLAAENRMNALREGSVAYLAAAVEVKKLELDTLHQLEGESNEEFRARQLAAEKAYSDAQENLWKGRIAVMQNAVSAASGLFTSLADMYESGTDVTEAEARKAKNLRIAGATIDMLSGVVAAISTAQELGVPMGPIMAAINSAAVIAAGTANINKIRSQNVSKDSSGSTTAATVSAPSFTPSVEEVRTITSASEEERLNQMAGDQRVYILNSDLEAARNSTAVQVAETTF